MQLTDEMIAELAGWLFIIEELPVQPQILSHRIKLMPDFSWYLTSMLKIIDWMKGCDGLEAVENAMIERGYDWAANYRTKRIGNNYGKGYYCLFIMGDIRGVGYGDNKTEAILIAAYKAMKKETK